MPKYEEIEDADGKFVRLYENGKLIEKRRIIPPGQFGTPKSTSARNNTARGGSVVSFGQQQ